MWDVQPKEYLGTTEQVTLFVIQSKPYNEKTKRLTCSYWNGPSKAPQFLDDYAFLIAGLLDLFECGGDYKCSSGLVEWIILCMLKIGF